MHRRWDAVKRFRNFPLLASKNIDSGLILWEWNAGDRDRTRRRSAWEFANRACESIQYIQNGNTTRKASSHDTDVRDLIEFQYASGWRVGSIMRLEKKDVDWQRETVKLRDAISKNKQPALLSFKKFPTMRAVLLRRKEKLRLDCPFIFHRNGRRIKDFRDEWKRATSAAKLAGLTDHALCRSCAVNLSRAGVFETVASKYMNRKTLQIYKLYRIVDTVDTELAGEAYQRYVENEAKAAKIAELENGHRQNSHSDQTEQAADDRK